MPGTIIPCWLNQSRWRATLKTRALMALWIGVGLVVVMGIYPPWVAYTFKTGDKNMPMAGAPVVYYGHHFLLEPPMTLGSPGQYAFIDLSRLIVQWVLVGAATLALVVTLNRRRDSDPRDERR